MERMIVAVRYHAHEIALLVISVILGINYLLAAISPPESIKALSLPTWFITMWALGLLSSGSLGLIAIFLQSRTVPLRDFVLYMRIEGAALVMSTGALLLIVTGTIMSAGMRGAFGIAFVIAWMSANIARSLQIRKEAKVLISEATKVGDADGI